MIVAIACDHAGFALKDPIISLVKKMGHSVLDFGTDSGSVSVDYPDFAAKAAEAVSSGKAQRAIILCGSGVGACITANKLKGARASVCHDSYSAAQGVEHDDMNILCLGARVIGQSLAEAVAKEFLNAAFSKDPRHMRRLDKLIAVESRNFK